MYSILSRSKALFISDSKFAFWVKVLIGTQFLALMAQVSIPLPLVPITGQTLAVTVIGLALGSRAGTAAVALYLLEGLCGMPVFANGSSGLARIIGPSGGYLLGFLPSVYLLGLSSDRGVLKSWWKTSVVAMLSALITMLCGMAQLAFYIPVERLLVVGFIPFIPGGIIKAMLASVMVVPSYRFFSKIH